MARPMVLNGPANSTQRSGQWAPNERPMSPTPIPIGFFSPLRYEWSLVPRRRRTMFPELVRPFPLTRLPVAFPVAFPEGERKKTICDRVYITNKYTCYR